MVSMITSRFFSGFLKKSIFYQSAFLVSTYSVLKLTVSRISTRLYGKSRGQVHGASMSGAVRQLELDVKK